MSFYDQFGSTIVDLYENKSQSIQTIADTLTKETGHVVYPNKVRRAIIKAGRKLRTKSEAQKLALDSGRHSHPTKGTKRSLETRIKISGTVSKYWENMSEDERTLRVNAAKEQWQNMTDEQRDSLRKAAVLGVKRAAKEGSRLEKFLNEALTEAGHVVILHRKGLVVQEDLEVDIYLPSYKIIIEIDGPAHFLPIWGEENLRRHITADSKKSGLLLLGGYYLIRVKNLLNNVSLKQEHELLSRVLEIIEQVDNKQLPQSDIIEVTLE